MMEKIRIGDKIVEVEDASAPVIKATAKEIRHPDGRVDIIIKVPCLQIAGGVKEKGKV